MHGLFAFYKQLQGVARGDINGYTVNIYYTHGKYLLCVEELIYHANFTLD